MLVFLYSGRSVEAEAVERVFSLLYESESEFIVKSLIYCTCYTSENEVIYAEFRRLRRARFPAACRCCGAAAVSSALLLLLCAPIHVGTCL